MLRYIFESFVLTSAERELDEILFELKTPNELIDIFL